MGREKRQNQVSGGPVKHRPMMYQKGRKSIFDPGPPRRSKARSAAKAGARRAAAKEAARPLSLMERVSKSVSGARGKVRQGIGELIPKSFWGKVGGGALIGLELWNIMSALEENAKRKEQAELLKSIPRPTPEGLLEEGRTQQRMARREALESEGIPGLRKREEMAMRQAALMSRDPEAYDLLLETLRYGRPPRRLVHGQFRVGGMPEAPVSDRDVQNVIDAILTG